MKIKLKFIGIAALISLVLPSLAATCQWNKNGGGKIDEADNWSALPTEADLAYFRYTQTDSLTLDNDMTVGIIRFGSSGAANSSFKGTLALGAGKTLAATNMLFYAASEVTLSSGILKLNAGSGAGRIRLGDGLNVTNEVNKLIVTGTDSHLETADSVYLDVGYVIGRNVVSIENGGSFTGSVFVASRAISTNNIIRVTGSGSTLTVPSTATTAPVLGVSGSGNVLEILDGGKVLFDLSGKTFTIGSSNNYGAGSNNWVRVSGSGSSFEDKTTLYVGYASKANFNGLAVEDGATATLGSALYIANNANSVSNRVVVSGSGSTLTVGGNPYIGAKDKSGCDGNSLEVGGSPIFEA